MASPYIPSNEWPWVAAKEGCRAGMLTAAAPRRHRLNPPLTLTDHRRVSWNSSWYIIATRWHGWLRSRSARPHSHDTARPDPPSVRAPALLGRPRYLRRQDTDGQSPVSSGKVRPRLRNYYHHSTIVPGERRWRIVQTVVGIQGAGLSKPLFCSAIIRSTPLLPAFTPFIPASSRAPTRRRGTRALSCCAPTPFSKGQLAQNPAFDSRA